MRTYIAVVHKDADSAFGISFPDVPGCFSAADSRDDILANAIDALAMHLEGLDAPESRDPVEVAADPDVKADLQEGAFLLAVPHVTMEKKPVRANISIDRGMLAAIDREARMRGMTRSAFIAEATWNEIIGRHEMPLAEDAAQDVAA